MGLRGTNESGFGLIELLIAMTVMAIGISAIVAGFSAGLLALNRASRTSTAGTLADRQMEAYRALVFGNISLNATAVASAAAPYAADAPAGSAVTSAGSCTVPSPWTPATACPVQSPVTGPDGRAYRVDTYIVWNCPGGGTPTGSPPTSCVGGIALRPLKQVTVVVRDVTTTSRMYFRETSTFDAAT